MATVFSAIVLVVVLLVGIWITQQVIDAMPSVSGTLGTAYNTTLSNIGSAFTLLSVLPIVIVAVGVLGVIVGAFSTQLRKD